ncbi:MAG: glycosyltransferase [Zoogloeaceae bacterium]|jgi:glycosyltransferase involved in cell wall biosynthesis|nr:glycosyltransferase [Zoogloeaceae bacterium]
MKKEQALVSIFMPTYNHAPFIEQAMESCLSQETSFPFELIICDDCSTDGTQEIIKKWAKKHKNIVVSQQPVNTTGAKNFMEGFQKIRSKYLAFCEGDDFWTVPHKLEKQVRFLEENPDFSVCCHKVELLFEDRPGDEKKQYIYKNIVSDDERIRQGIFYADEAIANYYFQTASTVYRWRFRDGLPHWFRYNMTVDHFILMLHAVEGKIKYFDEAMSVWRRNSTGYSWLQTVDKGLFFQKEGRCWLHYYREMDQFFSGRFHLQIRERILLALRGMVANCLETGQIEKLRIIIQNYQDYFLDSIKGNAPLLDAARLAFPENAEFAPPWSSTPSSAAHDEVVPGLPVLGGFMELDLDAVPETMGSVWEGWTQNHETACFASPSAALAAWLWGNAITCVWLPVIAPANYIALLSRLVACKFYPVGDSFSPPIDFVRQILPGEGVLTLSWLGRPPAPELCGALAARTDIFWLEDRSQALCTGVESQANTTLYSPAEVLGVPDGGILAGKAGKGIATLRPAPSAAEIPFSKKRRDVLLERFESPVIDNSIFLREAKIAQESPLPGGEMSRLTASLLRRIPLDSVVTRRKENYSALHDRLREWALWSERSPAFAPIVFPLRLPGHISWEFMATALTRQGIVCPRFWLPSTTREKISSVEKVADAESKLLKQLFCLPCDHRYGKGEMRRIADEVLRVLNGKSTLGRPGERNTGDAHSTW